MLRRPLLQLLPLKTLSEARAIGSPRWLSVGALSGVAQNMSSQKLTHLIQEHERRSRQRLDVDDTMKEDGKEDTMSEQEEEAKGKE